MQSISKEEMELLIKHNILRQEKGQYPDLVIVSKRKKHGGKTRYVTDPVYNQLKKLKKD